jgi:exosome complex RNA-binding protein Rrp42 (RNase PH superfamily)
VLRKQVWYLRVDIHVLDADGNLADAVVLSALAALLSFRRPDVSVGGADGRWGAACQGCTMDRRKSRL